MIAYGVGAMDSLMVGLLDPQAEDGIELGDHARIQGTPNVDVRIREEISQKGGLGTAAVAVNTIPAILAAAPGFHRMDELGLPHIWRGATVARPTPTNLRP